MVHHSLYAVSYQLARELARRKGSGGSEKLKRHKQGYALVEKVPQAGEKRVRPVKSSFHPARHWESCRSPGTASSSEQATEQMTRSPGTATGATRAPRTQVRGTLVRKGSTFRFRMLSSTITVGWKIATGKGEVSYQGSCGCWTGSGGAGAQGVEDTLSPGTERGASARNG